MFRIGQKVVCVKVNPRRTLIKGEIYTVTAVRQETGGVKLKEAEACPDSSGYFRPDRFRPIDEAFGENVAAAFEEQFAFETSDRRTEITA